jgi:hypothetical protein
MSPGSALMRAERENGSRKIKYEWTVLSATRKEEG